MVLRRSGAEPQSRTFAPIDSIRANLEAFAEAVAGGAPYSISTAEMLDTVAAFDAIAKAVKARGRIAEGEPAGLAAGARSATLVR